MDVTPKQELFAIYALICLLLAVMVVYGDAQAKQFHSETVYTP